jgi:hypothetical protein
MAESSFDPKPEVEAEDPFGKYFEGNEWELPTDLAVIDRAQEEIQKRLDELHDEKDQPYRNETESFEISLASREAIANGVIRGNLGVTESDSARRMDQIRARLAERGDKKLHVSIEYDADTFRLVVRDEGDGFDPRSVEDPTQVDSKMKTTGRGILMMRSAFDTVSYNKKGNEVTLSIGTEGVIGENDTDWPTRLPKRLKPEDVDLFRGNDNQWHWHVRPNKIKDPERRKDYIRQRNQWP